MGVVYIVSRFALRTASVLKDTKLIKKSNNFIKRGVNHRHRTKIKSMEPPAVPTDSLSAALHCLAGDVCLHVSGDYIPRCKPFAVPDCSRGIDPTAPSTWLCEDAHFFTLFRPNGAAGTLLFSHTNEVLYHASVETQLSKDCPPDLCFLCQFTTDSLPDGGVPRLLAFDVIAPKSPQPPGIRGDMLRGLQGHLPQPLCVVQWIGPRQYLSQEFIAKLPHRIRGLVALGDDPLMARALELNI